MSTEGEDPQELEHTRSALCSWLVELGVSTGPDLALIGQDRQHHTEEEARWLAANVLSGIHLSAHAEPAGQRCDKKPCVAEMASLALMEVCAFQRENDGTLTGIREDLVKLGRAIGSLERKRIQRAQQHVRQLIGGYRSNPYQAPLVEEMGWGLMEEMLQEVDVELREIGAAVVRWGESVSPHIPSTAISKQSIGGRGRRRGRLMVAVWRHLRDANVELSELARRVPGTTQQLPLELLIKRISQRMADTPEECRTFRRYVDLPLSNPEKREAIFLG